VNVCRLFAQLSSDGPVADVFAGPAVSAAVCGRNVMLGHDGGMYVWGSGQLCAAMGAPMDAFGGGDVHTATRLLAFKSGMASRNVKHACFTETFAIVVSENGSVGSLISSSSSSSSSPSSSSSSFALTRV
jgi:hypothetical protein